MRSPFEPADRELNLAARVGLATRDSLRYGRIAMLLVTITWLPLVLLALAEGSALGHPPTVPLLGDYLVFGRYLVALPLLVAVHPVVDRQIAIALTTLGKSGLVAGEAESALDRHLDRARALWQNPIVRIALLAASIVTAIAALPARSLVLVSSWAIADESGNNSLTGAGWYSLFVAGPLVRFLLLLALWKLLIWWSFIWRLARTPLRYEPLHPDRCAGLGFLDQVQVGFAVLVAALSVQMGCLIADAVTYQGAELESYKLAVAAFAALMMLMLFAPLLAFLPPIARACKRAETGFHAWAGHASRQLGARLRDTGDAGVAAQLASPEISTLTDATTLFEGTQRTRRIPASRRALATVLAASLLPMCIPLLPLLPLQELAKRLAGIVL